MHSFAFWIIAWPLVTAVLVYPFRKKWLSGAIASLCSLMALWLVRAWPAGDFWVFGYRLSATEPWRFSGGTFIVTVARKELLLAYAVLASVGILALAFDSYRKALVWAFVWASALSALWEATGVGGVFFLLVLASSLGAIGVAGKPHARGGWRAMLFPSLSYPLVLIAMWYASQAPLNPEDGHVLFRASMLISAAIFLSLMIFPFHGAFPAIGEEANPPAGFVWFMLWPAAVWSVVLKMHQSLTWWHASRWTSWVELSLLGTLILVAAAGFWQRSPGRVLGYAVLATWTLFLQTGTFGSMGLWERGVGIEVAVLGLTMLRETLEAVPFRWRRHWKALATLLYLAGIWIVVLGIIKSGSSLKSHRLMVYGAAFSLLVGSVVASAWKLSDEGIFTLPSVFREEDSGDLRRSGFPADPQS